ncbi:DUF4221 domain-containing protein [Chitinophaga rhizophila]|uniref:DUF4221 domain-containing protein n=1 Tax=Chitinophaga rhizophila TaxID=2866212 RepID=A0ABS7G896_9BACT|nr:DUF4221 domain-containing protein [Chitinophaga rhizophila]MBW8683887.1 DUF4221 domain-containing protein [Chitinophaga rhizophila]
MFLRIPLMPHSFAYVMILCLFVSCSNSTRVEMKNEKHGSLKAVKTLTAGNEKKFPLDSLSAPRPPYIQIYNDDSGKEYLAMLSGYSKNIFVYNYDSAGTAVNQIPIGAIQMPLAFHIRNMDSIYVYNDKMMEMILLNNKSEIVSKVSLINNENMKDLSWANRYPQYVPHTVNPILEHEGKLVFPGQFIWTLPDTVAQNFKFTSLIDINSNKVNYVHKYPYEIYGHGYIWDEPLFTAVYHEAMPDNKRIIYSFPVSHDLIISDLDGEQQQRVYGGSNEAASISSFDAGKFKTKSGVSKEYIYQKGCTSDLYGGILYDKYRDVYYRFLRKALPEKSTRLRWENKKVAVVVMDKDFKYLGETEIGDLNEFYPENAFVTREGLNVEYVAPNDVDEKFLTFKIFTLKDI